MSAIAGIFYLDGRPATASDLQPVMDATAFYGGDGQGVWADGPVALGHHMRHLTPQSLHDSMPRCLGNLTLVADVRLDNRANLFTALAIPAEDQADIPDSVLILRAYQQWGQATAGHLIGDFAFAIWDAGSQTLYCARDHVGARPFYYHHDGQRFAFSTEIEALFTLPEVVIDPDEDFIIDNLRSKRNFHYHPHHTFYRNFKRLPFAHTLTVTAAGPQLRQYWQPVTEPTLDLGDDEAYFARVRELLGQAVRDRLRTNLTVGAHLSGGVDSSSIAILAARHQRERGSDLKVYSWSPPAGENPDRSLEQYRIEAICRQEGLVPCYAPSAPVSIREALSLDQIRLSSEKGVAQQAVADGVRLMLSGWGGDEFVSFNGRGYRADLFARLRWVRLLKTLNWSQFPRGLLTNVRFLWRDVVLVFGPQWLYQWSTAGQLLRRPKDDFLKPNFAARVQQSDSQARPLRYQERGVKETQRGLYALGHLPSRMERWCAGGALHNITYTYPFLDRRVLEFVFRLPDHLFVRDGMGRYMGRMALTPLFPPDTMDVRDINPKAEPSMLRHNEVLRQYAFRNIESDVYGASFWDTIASNPWVDTDRLQRALANHTVADASRADTLAIGNAMSLVQVWNQLSKKRVSVSYSSENRLRQLRR